MSATLLPQKRTLAGQFIARNSTSAQSVSASNKNRTHRRSNVRGKNPAMLSRNIAGRTPGSSAPSARVRLPRAGDSRVRNQRRTRRCLVTSRFLSTGADNAVCDSERAIAMATTPERLRSIETNMGRRLECASIGGAASSPIHGSPGVNRAEWRGPLPVGLYRVDKPNKL